MNVSELEWDNSIFHNYHHHHRYFQVEISAHNFLNAGKWKNITCYKQDLTGNMLSQGRFPSKAAKLTLNSEYHCSMQSLHPVYKLDINITCRLHCLPLLTL